MTPFNISPTPPTHVMDEEGRCARWLCTRGLRSVSRLRTNASLRGRTSKELKPIDGLPPRDTVSHIDMCEAPTHAVEIWSQMLPHVKPRHMTLSPTDNAETAKCAYVAHAKREARTLLLKCMCQCKAGPLVWRMSHGLRMRHPPLSGRG